MELKFNAFRWSEFGPFFFQTSRLFHYLVYFLLGAGVGAYGLERGLLAADGKLARRWWLWVIGAVIAFVVTTAVTLVAIAPNNSPRTWEIAADFTFVISCAAS